MTEVETIKKQLKAKPKTVDIYKDALSTGLPTLNLALSGSPNKGLIKGGYYLLPGESSSGKSFLSMQCLAEAANNPAYSKYALDYYDIERGVLMNVRSFFGRKLEERLKIKSANSLEHFFDQAERDMEDHPCIIILDTPDALDSEGAIKVREEQAKAREKGKEAPGSYGAQNAKALKAGLRALSGKTGPLAKHGSILVIVSQVIDQLAFSFEKTTRAGGKSLKFFAQGEIWFKVKQGIKKTIKGKTRKIGSLLEMTIKKNRQTGAELAVTVPFYPSVGFDPVGGCVNWLVEEGFWKSDSKKEGTGSVTAPEFKFKGSTEELIKTIQAQNKERELELLVAEKWEELQEACRVDRKRRYE